MNIKSLVLMVLLIFLTGCCCKDLNFGALPKDCTRNCWCASCHYDGHCRNCVGRTGSWIDYEDSRLTDDCTLTHCLTYDGNSLPPCCVQYHIYKQKH